MKQSELKVANAEETIDQDDDGNKSLDDLTPDEILEGLLSGKISRRDIVARILNQNKSSN